MITSQPTTNHRSWIVNTLHIPNDPLDLLTAKITQLIQAQLPFKYQPIQPYQITHIIHQKKSLGIEMIRQLQEQLVFAFAKPQFFCLHQCELLTEIAQNSLLKLLEEPPTNAWIILLTNNPDQLLETIKSRCLSLRLETNIDINVNLPPERKPTTTNANSLPKLLQFLESNHSTKAIANVIDFTKQHSTPEQTQQWLEELIYAATTKLEGQILEPPNQADTQLLKIARYGLLALHRLKQNFNSHLVIDQFLLNLIN